MRALACICAALAAACLLSSCAGGARRVHKEGPSAAGPGYTACAGCDRSYTVTQE